MEDNAVLKGLELIKQFEGLRLKAYQDQKGIWTVGYGSTGMFVTSQTVWTKDQANLNLRERVDGIYLALRRHIIPPLNSNEWAALISLAYNIGITALFGSTLFKKINERDAAGAADEFLKWDHITVNNVKTVDEGLLARRQHERAIFLTP